MEMYPTLYPKKLKNMVYFGIHGTEFGTSVSDVFAASYLHIKQLGEQAPESL